MYTPQVSPTQIQQYRLQNPASFQRSDEDIASMIKNQSSTPNFSRQATQAPKQPSAGQQLLDQAKNQAIGYGVNEGAKAGLEAADVDAADVGGYLGAAKGAWGAVNALTSNAPNDVKAREARQQAENAGAGMATGGISTLAQLADNKLLGGKFEKARDKAEKNPLYKFANPGGWGTSKVVEKGLSMFGSGKGKDQQQRDQIRAMLQKNKFLDDKYGMILNDGSSFDIGRDGGAKDAAGNPILSLDFTDSKPGDLQSMAIGNVNPLAAIITGGNKKLSTDFATYFTKGTMSNANNDPAVVRANAIKQYSNAGLDRDKAIAAIADLEKQGKVTTDDATAYKNGISMLFGGGGSTRSASEGNRGATSSSRPVSKPKPKRRPSDSGNPNILPVPASTPVTLSPTSTQGYDDNFAQNMANIYSQNQG